MDSNPEVILSLITNYYRLDGPPQFIAGMWSFRVGLSMRAMTRTTAWHWERCLH